MNCGVGPKKTGKLQIPKTIKNVVGQFALLAVNF
jgi:hypothetical protein